MQIKDMFGHHHRGWGSIPVSVTVGNTTWTTSIFPDKESSSYILPLKADVRKAESINSEDIITITLRIR